MAGKKAYGAVYVEQSYGTIKAPAYIDPEADAEVLQKAMKGLGTDEAAIINLLTKRTNAQRQQISTAFKQKYGKNLIKELKSELSGHFQDFMVALMEPPILYDAKCLRCSMKGPGTDEAALIEILCTRTNLQIQEIKVAYKREFSRDLEKDIKGDTSGRLEKLLLSMCQGAREETGVDISKATWEAQELYQVGGKQWEYEESKFNQILATRSFPQLRATFDEYTKVSQRDILISIDYEISENLKEGFTAAVKCARSAPAYFAERLYKSMKRWGTDDDTLIRVVVSRSEVDLVEIKQEFLKMYNQSLYKMIEGDTSGDYRKALCAVVGADV